MRGAAPVFSSARVGENKIARDDWQTPENVLERVRKVGPILLDPCTDESNPTKAERFYVERENGLVQLWDVTPGGVTFCNPPYSQVAAWAERASVTWSGSVILLVPARTDTRWFHNHVWPSASRICFLKGRLRFVGGESCAPFPSAVVLYAATPENIWDFEDAFKGAGWVVS